jgi:hypothetical protein
MLRFRANGEKRHGQADRWITVVVGLLPRACAPMIWDKVGATQDDYNKDSYECEKDARQSGYFGGGITGEINMRDFFKKCMVAHGYTLRQ